MTGVFAQGTSVPEERSRAEIERILRRYGASKFGTWNEETRATIQFETKQGRLVQLPVPLPTPKECPQGKRPSRNGSAADRWVEQERRRRWRVMVITLKAMLEAVDSGLMTFEQVFLAHLVVPGTARTLGDELIPRLPALYSGTSLPRLLVDVAKETK